MSPTALGAFFLSAGILTGAFGAHGLEGNVTPERLETWNTAALYHLINACGLVAIGVLHDTHPDRIPGGAANLLVAGILIFSGSLYALVLTDTAWLGAVTPFGGLALAASWLWIGLSVLSPKSSTKERPTQ